MTRRFQAALRDAGPPRLRFHDSRHGAATLLLDQGVPLTSIQELLGHASLYVTKDIYAHFGETLRCEVTDAMDEALGS